MRPSDWLRVKDVLAGALDRPAGERPAFLADACGGDEVLRAEVVSLLEAHDAAGDFIDTPAAALSPGALAGSLAAGSVEEPAADADSNVGRRVGAYVLERLLGRGGMGAVYLATRADREFDRQAAVKMIRRGMDTDAVVRRFRHERQILASLDHPHIARLFDGGTTDDGLPYFVMEYVDGLTIDRFADAHRLTTPERVRLFLRVLDAVQHAHDRHVVHRDIKPSNILVTPDGQPKLLDFGIAKLLDDGAAGGTTITLGGRPMTPDFASPEQVRGEAITGATDVYSLGLVFYELLTGRRAYHVTGSRPEEIARVVCGVDPVPPSDVVARASFDPSAGDTTRLPAPDAISAARAGSPAALRRHLRGSLDAVALKALRKDSHERYASPAEFADDLRRYLDSRPVTAYRGRFRYGARRAFARHRVSLFAAAALMVAVLVGVAALALGRRASGAATGGPLTASSQAAPPGAATTVDPRAAPRQSAAIVPFRNLAGRADDAWLSVALAEMLATELARDGAVRLVPPDRVASAMRDLSVMPGGAVDPGPLRERLGVDHLVAGTFTVGTGTPRALRLDVQVLDGEAASAAATESGPETDLFALVTAVGRGLRAGLGLAAAPADDARAVRATLPSDPQAARFYAAGLTHLRSLEPVAARDVLEKASALEPANPTIRTALAAAWTALGYDTRAAAEAQAAFDRSGDLPREQRLDIEGRLHDAQKQWAKAVDVYRTLWGFFADNAEYGLRFAAALTSAGRGQEALAVVGELRALPGAQAADPRIDLAESAAASAVGDLPRELDAVRRAATRAERAGARQVVARARLAEGRALYLQGQFAQAVTVLDAARRAFEAAGDRAGIAAALNSIGAARHDSGDAVLGERYYRESLAAAESIGDRRMMSNALNNLGILLKDAGRFGDALAAHERALAIRRDIADRGLMASSLNNVALIRMDQGRLDDAVDGFTQALELGRSIGNRRIQGMARSNLALVQRAKGDFAAARAVHEASVAEDAAANDTRSGTTDRVNLGIVLVIQGELAAARRTLEEAAAMGREIGFVQGEALAVHMLAELARLADDLGTARHLYEDVLVKQRGLRETRSVAETLVALAGVTLHEGRAGDAARALEEAETLAREIPNTLAAAQCVRVRERLLAGDVAGAVRAATRARALLGSSADVMDRLSVTLADGEVAVARRDLAAAGRLARDARSLTDTHGMPLLGLEARLLQLRVAAAERAPDLSTQVARVAADARARGAMLAAREAEALLK